MLLPRALRTLRTLPAYSPSFSSPPMRLALLLPIRTRYLSTSVDQTSDHSGLSETIPQSTSSGPSSESSSEAITSASIPPSSEQPVKQVTEISNEIPTEETTEQAPQLPYFVNRNNLANLSVYQKSKRGGNFKVTLLKKAEGDLKALKADIRDALQLPDSDVSVNNVTRHIAVRVRLMIQAHPIYLY